MHPHALKDPCGDRPVKSVPLPPAIPLSVKEVYDKDGLPDMRVIRDHLNLEGTVEKALVVKLVERATDIFKKEPNLLKVK